MKKLVLMFVAIAAISFASCASCGNNTKTAATNADSLSDTAAVEDTVAPADSLTGDSL